MKLLKIALYGLGGLVLLAALALAGALAIVDGKFVKTRLEREMKERNRTLTIEGEPRLRFFPVAGIELGKTALSEAGSSKVFLALDSAQVAVRTMPLLAGAIELETLNAAGLRVNLVRGKDGRMNFSDLAAGEEPSGPGRVPRFSIAGMNVERAQISYRDEASGQELTVAELNVKAGRLDGDTPGPVQLSARITGKRPDADLRAQASGAMRFKLGRQEYGFDGFQAQLKGRLDRDALVAELQAPKLEVSPARAGGSQVTGSFEWKGPQRSVEAKLKIAAIEGSASALKIPSLLLEFIAVSAGTTVKGNLEAALKADLAKQALDADVKAKLDESAIKAKLAASRIAPLVATFALDVDRINLDRYLPAKKDSGKPDDRIDLSALKGPALNGKAEIGALTVQRVKLANVKAEIKLANGKLEISPHSASLYEGTLAGAISVDANGNQITVREDVKNVNMAPLIRDSLGREENLEGRGNLALDVAGAGSTVTAVKKSLAGNGRVLVRDGAIKGVNVAETLRRAKSFGARSVQSSDRAQKTDFSELSASFVIKRGVAHNEDLAMKSPALRLSGAGDIDIGNNTIDYRAKASVVGTAKGQDGRELSELRGVTIPVHVSGSLDKPSYEVDLKVLAGSALLGAGSAVGQTGSSLGQKIKGLFGR